MISNPNKFYEKLKSALITFIHKHHQVNCYIIVHKYDYFTLLPHLDYKYKDSKFICYFEGNYIILFTDELPNNIEFLLVNNDYAIELLESGDAFYEYW